MLLHDWAPGLYPQRPFGPALPGKRPVDGLYRTVFLLHATMRLHNCVCLHACVHVPMMALCRVCMVTSRFASAPIAAHRGSLGAPYTTCMSTGFWASTVVGACTPAGGELCCASQTTCGYFPCVPSVLGTCSVVNYRVVVHNPTSIPCTISIQQVAPCNLLQEIYGDRKADNQRPLVSTKCVCVKDVKALSTMHNHHILRLR